MPAGAPSYLNALTDTRRCLPCTIIICGKRKCVNPLAAAVAILPARICRNSDRKGVKKPRRKACSTGRTSGQSGAWGRGSPVATARCRRHPAAPTKAAAETPNERIGKSQRDIPIHCSPTVSRIRDTPPLQAKSIHQVLPMLSECASKNSFYICIVIPTRKDSSPGTRSRSPPWPSMIFRTEESPIPCSADALFRERNVFPS